MGFPRLLRAYWIGNFLSNYLPSNIGGDVARVLVLRHAAGVAPLAGSVLVERLTGVAALAVISGALPSASAGGAVEPATWRSGCWLARSLSVSCWSLPPDGRLLRGGDALLGGLPQPGPAASPPS